MLLKEISIDVILLGVVILKEGWVVLVILLWLLMLLFVVNVILLIWICVLILICSLVDVLVLLVIFVMVIEIVCWLLDSGWFGVKVKFFFVFLMV